MKQFLTPTMECLGQEFVLVQAWKKTSKHLRYHSWYADTLEIDFQSTQLPTFIKRIQDRLAASGAWSPSPLRVVPAPKSERWTVDRKSRNWKPVQQKTKTPRAIRPLAHVDLEDQVLATAMMLCLADHLETLQGDPCLPLNDLAVRKTISSYGNRLFCDVQIEADELCKLHHRWGSGKLYRAFFHDYRTFLKRPELVADGHKLGAGLMGEEVAIVQIDLSKFYDRVTPSLLHEKVRKHAAEVADEAFIRLFESLFEWEWREASWAEDFAKEQKLRDGFQSVALPQGLVASGFFSNFVLFDFDSAIRERMGHVIGTSGNVRLNDYCRYVDDLRLVVNVRKDTSEDAISQEVVTWLKGVLDEAAPGMEINPEKTKVTVEGRERRILIRQSSAANRIQSQASGVLDAFQGIELIGAIEGFFHTQRRYSEKVRENPNQSLLVGIPDLRDETAARFSAGKFRATFRSLRPMLSSAEEPKTGAADEEVDSDSDDELQATPYLRISKQQLDYRAKVFAATLVEEWVSDPSNVRLLRIALDFYPDVRFLEEVLVLLREGYRRGGAKGHRKEVMLYCLGEIFRAGATETGIVDDPDSLPAGTSLKTYRAALRSEALKVLDSWKQNRSSVRFPWYLMQQVFLFLAAVDGFPETPLQEPRRSELHRYAALARVLGGCSFGDVEDYPSYFVVALSGFGIRTVLDQFSLLEGPSIELLKGLAEISPSVALEVIDAASTEPSAMPWIGGLFRNDSTPSYLATIARAPGLNPFWFEDNLLKLASGFLRKRSEIASGLVTPWEILVTLESRDGRSIVKDVILAERVPLPPVDIYDARRLFELPDWCEGEDAGRFELGQVLRFALRGNLDFNRGQGKSLVANTYRQVISHWELSRYGSFQGREAFGPDWLPLSSDVTALLFDLLRWPGCGPTEDPPTLSKILESVEARLVSLEHCVGDATGTLFLNQSFDWPHSDRANSERELRIGIVQSVLPRADDFRANSSDLTLTDNQEFRRRHRNHIATLMAAMSQMLEVRRTHRPVRDEEKEILDWLLFPELAIHPDDVDSLLLPFVRKHRCMILCGLTYHRMELLPKRPLINSALWIIPEFSKKAGLSIRRVEQGKFHLAKDESGFAELVPFRPAQWLVNYPPYPGSEARPLVLTAAICYDATDLALASDLRHRSDLFAIPALNQDVGAFDRMIESLHYHLYQGMLLVNNGEFGGSNFYLPYADAFRRQVFHLHGQPQAQIAFVEVNPSNLIRRGEKPRQDAGEKPEPKISEPRWKTPPAGWKEW